MAAREVRQKRPPKTTYNKKIQQMRQILKEQQERRLHTSGEGEDLTEQCNVPKLRSGGTVAFPPPAHWQEEKKWSEEVVDA